MSSTGRPCACCRSVLAAEIDGMLREGVSDAAVSRAFRVSPDSVRRHRIAHLVVDLDVISSSRGPVAVAVRLREVADAARSIRLAAAESGRAALSLRAGDAEVKALGALAAGLGITHEGWFDALDEAYAIAKALKRLEPEHGAAVVAAMAATGAHDLAAVWATAYGTRSQITNPSNVRRLEATK